MNLYSKRGQILLFILILFFILSACQKVEDSVSGTTSTPEVSALATSEPENVIVQADVVFGPGAFIYPDTTAGLADLSSYKATLTLTFDGTRDGQPSQWSKTYVMLAAKDPAARQLTIEKTENLAEFTPILMAEMDGVAYERFGESACTANVIEPENSLIGRLEPAGLLNGMIGAEDAGGETVNNIAANHYTFDERAFGQLGLVQSNGEVWIASEGDYIVRYLLTTKGNADYFGEGIEGALVLDYALSDINQPVTIELPADCPAGMVDTPLLPGASNVLDMPSVLKYDTASSLTDAVAFYQEKIPSLGWTLLSEPIVGETTAFLKYKQGDQELIIMITTETDVRKIIILKEKPQE